MLLSLVTVSSSYCIYVYCFRLQNYCFSHKRRINILRRYLPILRNLPPTASRPLESTNTPSPHSVDIKISFCDTIVSRNRSIWGISTAISTCGLLDVGYIDHFPTCMMLHVGYIDHHSDVWKHHVGDIDHHSDVWKHHVGDIDHYSCLRAPRSCNFVRFLPCAANEVATSCLFRRIRPLYANIAENY